MFGLFKGRKQKASRFEPPLQPEQLRVQLFSGEVANLLDAAVAKRPLGDAALIVVADMRGVAEHTLQWTDLDELGLSHDEAFALGQRNATAQMLGAIHVESLGINGAGVELLISNDFYLAGMMLEARSHLRPGVPLVIAPLTWHHWISFELMADATRRTLLDARTLAAHIRDNITTIQNMSAWVTQSLWWWPSGSDPAVLDLDHELPGDLAAKLTT